MSSIKPVISYSNYYRTVIKNTPSFKGTFQENVARRNSGILYNLIDKNKYDDALDFVYSLNEDNFTPNYPKIGENDLIGVIIAKRKKGLSEAKSKQLNQILRQIVSHKDFNPNSGNIFSLAVLEADDLVGSLLASHPKFRDEYNDGFKTYKRMASSMYFTKGALDKLSGKPETSALYPPLTSKLNANINKTLEPYIAVYSKSDPKGLKDVGGMFEAKNEIEEFIIKPWQPRYAKLIRENSVQMPNGFLMYGPPGCGKTFLAKAIGAELKIPMFEISLSDVGSHLAYSTQKELKNVFNALEELYKKNETPNILFLDELDSICGKRKDTKTDWLRGEINMVLKLINNASDKGIILIGATNLLEDLDPAVLRPGRFDKKLHISLPDFEERKSVFSTLSENRPIALSVKSMLEPLASLTEGFTNSDINAVFHHALRNAIFENKNTIGYSDFESAAKKIETTSKYIDITG